MYVSMYVSHTMYDIVMSVLIQMLVELKKAVEVQHFTNNARYVQAHRSLLLCLGPVEVVCIVMYAYIYVCMLYIFV